MASEIALNHHEKYDGGGYPGHIDDIFSDRSAWAGASKVRRFPCSPGSSPCRRL